jgi:uncharacterized delta-60 repeat protein
MPSASPFRPVLRRLLRCAFLAGLIAFGCAGASAQSAADGFAPDVDGVVNAVVIQPDGKVLLGGQFSSVDGFPRANVARLNPDGSVDASFDPAFNGPVRTIALQRDGRIVLGGDFTSLQPRVTGAAVTRLRLARLNADGTPDASFAPSLAGPLQPQVHSVLVQADGRIVAGGTFTTVQAPGAAAAVTRNYLARFNADGSLDAAFNPSPNGIVLGLALHVENKLVVAGGFTALTPGGAGTAVTRNRLARLNADGSLDGGFNPNANNVVNGVAVQRDGKVLLVGGFTALQPTGAESPLPLQRLARLNVDGSVDGDFYPRVNGPVSSVTVQGDGMILVGGAFTSVWGKGAASVTRAFVARFLPDGTVDTAFAPNLNGTVNAVAVQADGKVVLGGVFTRAAPEGATTALVRNRVARVNANGSLDATFALDAGGRTLASVTQADGKIVIGGSFTSVAGSARTYLARLNADGTLDPDFKPELNDRVFAVALQADGKILAAGAFTTAAGARRERLVRISPNGAVDPDFFPLFDGPVGTLLVLSDGRILVGGTFNSVTPHGATESSFRANLVRLNANGTLDTTFDPNPNSTVSAVALQPDGKLLIAGLFSAVRPGASTNTNASFVSRGYVARLESSGALDTTFQPLLNGQVSTLALQADGKVVLGGAFTTVIGSDGKLDKEKRDDGSTFDIAPVRNRIARLEANGNLDATYNPNANGNVLVSARQTDGKVVIGGTFTTLQPNGAATFTLRKYAARLNADGTVDTTFDLDLSESPGNRVDSLRLQADGRLYVGGAFTSLRPTGTAANVARRNFARLLATGAVDLAFDAAAGGVPTAAVNALALQPDGRVIAVGQFSDLGGSRGTNLARFRAEGTPDPDFSPALATDGPVHAVAVRTAGAPVPTQLGGFAWLAANGTLRSAFAAAATRLSGEITAVAVDARGRVLLGGTFANLSGTTGGNLVRFLPNGTIDASFNPRPNGAIAGIVVQPDGRILVVGNFTTVSDTARNRIARIDDNGALDVTYDPSANAAISSLVLQPDGKAVVGGAFTAFTPNLTSTAVPRSYLARVNENGTIDTNYNPSPNSNVNALVLQADGKVVAGGLFTSVIPNATGTPVTRNHLARFNADGSLDTGYNPNPNAQVDTLAAAGNQLVVGGAFSSLQPGAAGAVVERSGLARLNADGTVDGAFNPSPDGGVRTVAVQADGAVVIGGSFTALRPSGGASVTRNRLARVARDGSLDLDFNPDIRGAINVVSALADGTLLVGGNFSDLQLSGSVLVGGDFSVIGGVGARHLAMLNDNGSVATSFQPRPNAPVRTLLALPDGRVLAGGAFTSIGGAARAHLVRLNADGGLDAAYNPVVPQAVSALALQPDGRVLVGHATGVLRLNANGSADASFSATLNGPVTGLAVQPDGRILALQGRTLVRLTVAGASAGAALATGDLRAFTLLADGGIVVAGTGAITTASGASRANLALLSSAGDLVPAFNPAPDAAVSALAAQADGRLMVAGRFRQIGGVSRPALARLSSVGVGGQTLGVAANRGSVTFSRTGPVAEASAVVFEQSADLVSWTTLGNGVRAAGAAAWQLAGLNLPASGSFYVRARAIVAGSAGVSGGIQESVREFNYASPVPGLAIPGSITTAPSAAAAQAVIDGATGVLPRSVISAVPGEGTVEIRVQGDTAAADAGPARLANLSTRGRVEPGSPLILGFAIAGDEPRRVLVRGVGPALEAFGVTGALSAPRLELQRTDGQRVTGNEGWGSAADIARVAGETGAFPFRAGSADSAAVVTLAPGTYTIQISDARGAGGVALAEIYDAGAGTRSRLVNVSSLGRAGTGGDALISGFVLEGGAAARLLLRGVGPGLTRLGGLVAAEDPSLALYDGAGVALGANDNWVASVPEVAEAALRSGAFALAPGSRDAAVLAVLPAGVYTVQVSAAGGGPALLEVYEVRY